MKKLLYGSYLILLTILPQHFSRANSTPDCLAVDIVLLVDRSYSQGQQLYEMQYALQNVLFELPINSAQVRVGIISFADSATLQSSIIADGDQLRFILDSLYDLPITIGRTSMGKGVEMIPSLFETSTLTRKGDAYKAVVILSDGEISGWEYALPGLRYLEKKYAADIYAVGVGSDQFGEYVLRRMVTDSTYFGGNDIEQVIEKIQKSYCH